MAFATNSVRKLAILASAVVIIFFMVRTYSRPYWNYFDAPATAPVSATGQRPSDQSQKSGRPSSSPRSRISFLMQEYLSWNPPVEIKEHYPPYSDYDNRDYDPNRWEDFEQKNSFYYNGTLKSLESDSLQPFPYDPYPDYNSAQWQTRWRGKYVPCNGPSGKPIDKSSSEMVQAYRGTPKGFPVADTGAYHAVGLDEDVCFDRFARLGPYGVTEGESSPDFSNVNWIKLQNDCMRMNKDRFADSSLPQLGPTSEDAEKRSLHARDPQLYDYATTTTTSSDSSAPTMQSSDDTSQNTDSGPSSRSRTAVLIRGWDDYVYEDNDIQAIRSLITELNLLSGGEYHVFLFVNVKDPSIPLFTDKKVYDAQLEARVPSELRDIAILWTEAVSYSWYQNVGEWSVYFQQFMPVQWFSKTHPEFDYIWNWEMDARYIGQHYHFLESIAKFAREQPRKYLWERNARYYFPAVHGSYENFTRDTNKIVAETPYIKSVWGPDKWKEDQETFGPTPPTTEEEDDFSWGVGEEADFISLLPMWDPRETFWSYRDKVWGYEKSATYANDRPYRQIPRRTFINTVVRLSKPLLEAMHRENIEGYSMASEMWPSSTALQHGFKAVYAPHPIWFAHHWPSDYLEHVINADGWGAGSGVGDTDHGRGAAFDPDLEVRGLGQQGTGPNSEGKQGRWCQERDSPYSPDREHNFAGWSWYFWSDFPKVIYWRWLGWMSSFNIVTIQGVQSNDELRQVNWTTWESEHGRMCLPGMLLHPVKNVKAPE